MNKRILLSILIFFIGISHASELSLQKRIDSLKIVLKKTPNNPGLYYKLGCCNYSLKQYAAAESAFKKVLEFKNYEVDATIKLANVYAYLGKYKDMYDLCNNYIQSSSPFNNIIQCQAGIAASLLNKNDEAINLFTIYYDSSYYISRISNSGTIIAMIYLYNNDTIQSNIWLKKSQKGDYAPSDMYFSYYLLGKYSQAIDEVQKNATKHKIGIHDQYNLSNFMIITGNKDGLDKLKATCESDTQQHYRDIYEAVIYIRFDSLAQAEQKLLNSSLTESGIRNALLAWIYEKTGRAEEANVYWYNCFGRVPLGINVNSMRNFINRYIEIIKN